VYESSLFVVVPVVESEIGAGLTTIAEAMAMGKAVITSRAEGQSDTVVDRRAQLRGRSGRATTGGVVKTFGMDVDDPDLAGPTGLYVTPGDAGQLRDASATWWLIRSWRRTWASGRVASRSGCWQWNASAS
jgi:glycosyltransferase involved in cell wall biosynthesis